MTTIITPTTELEAVNSMLDSIGETPISTFEGASVVDVTNARTILARVSRAVQSRGWHFNTEHEYPLIPDVDGFVDVPANTAKVVVDRLTYTTVDPVQRGTRMYDIKNRTYVFTATFNASMVFLLPFDELPEPARYYFFMRAAREFQEASVGSSTLEGFTEKNEQVAHADFTALEQETRKYNMADSISMNWVKRRRIR